MFQKHLNVRVECAQYFGKKAILFNLTDLCRLYTCLHSQDYLYRTSCIIVIEFESSKPSPVTGVHVSSVAKLWPLPNVQTSHFFSTPHKHISGTESRVVDCCVSITI